MTARYVRKDRVRAAGGCRACGSFWGQPSAKGACGVTTCMACETPQCMSNGLGRGQCSICLVGLLTGWGMGDRPCGYKGCTALAVAAVPRVQYACREHLKRAVIQREPAAKFIAAQLASRSARFVLWEDA